MLLLSITLVFASPITVIVLAAGLGGLLRLEGLSWKRLARESAFLFWIGAFALVLQGLDFEPGLRVNPEGLSDSGLYLARLSAAFFAGRLFYATTTRLELRDTATLAMRRLPGRGRSDAGLAVFLILGFIPLIVEEWKASLEAAKSRGLPRHFGISRSAVLLSAFLRRLIIISLDLPQALSARAWAGDRCIQRSRWRARDYVALAFAASLALAGRLKLV